MSSDVTGQPVKLPQEAARQQAGPGEASAKVRRVRALDRVQAAYQAHPLLVTWLVLAIGMVAILLWASRDVELLFHQRLILVLATVGLAGLCAWIIGWEA